MLIGGASNSRKPRRAVSLDYTGYAIPVRWLGEVTELEERLLFGRAVKYRPFVGDGVKTKQPSMVLGFAVRRLGWAGAGWALLEHLENWPVRSGIGLRLIAKDPLVEVHMDPAGPYWLSFGVSGNLEGVEDLEWMDVGRLQRLMQLLGMLDHSRVEEWKRSQGA